MLSKNLFIGIVLFTVLFTDLTSVRADEDNLRKKQVPHHKRTEGMTREALIDNHNQRKEKLEELLQETKDKVADHEEGRKLLEDDEYTTMKKRVGLYGQKLERMKEPLDSRDIERMLERERMRAERYNRFEL